MGEKLINPLFNVQETYSVNIINPYRFGDTSEEYGLNSRLFTEADEDHVTIQSTIKTILEGTSYTVACWVYLDTTPNLISRVIGNDSNVSTEFALQFRNEQMRAVHDTTQLFSGSSTVPIQTWNHFALTFSTTNGAELYVNGSSADSDGALTTQNSFGSDDIVIGNRTSGGVGLDGNISELLIYDEELSSARITTLQTGLDETGLVARFFAETDTVNDILGNYTATNSGSAFSTDGPLD